jgi:hypothetical protein
MSTVADFAMSVFLLANWEETVYPFPRIELVQRMDEKTLPGLCGRWLM